MPPCSRSPQSVLPGISTLYFAIPDRHVRVQRRCFHYSIHRSDCHCCCWPSLAVSFAFERKQFQSKAYLIGRSSPRASLVCQYFNYLPSFIFSSSSSFSLLFLLLLLGYHHHFLFFVFFFIGVSVFSSSSSSLSFL